MKNISYCILLVLAISAQDQPPDLTIDPAVDVGELQAIQA